MMLLRLGVHLRPKWQTESLPLCLVSPNILSLRQIACHAGDWPE